MGTLLERYNTPEEKLAVNDALMILVYICNYYQEVSSNDNTLAEQITEWKIREIEVHAQLKDTLEAIKKSSSEGNWPVSKVLKHKNIEGRLTDEYLQEKLGNLYFPENVELAKMLYFAMVVIGATENNNQNLTCVEKFNELYPVLVDKIAREHPEYFAGNVEAMAICEYDHQLGVDEVIIYTILS